MYLICGLLLVVGVGSNFAQRHLLLEARELDQQEAVQAQRIEHLQALQDALLGLRLATWERMWFEGSAIDDDRQAFAAAWQSVNARLDELDARDATLGALIREHLDQFPDRVQRRLRQSAEDVRGESDMMALRRGLLEDLLENDRAIVAARTQENARLAEIWRGREAAKDASVRAAGTAVITVTLLSFGLVAMIILQVLNPMHLLVNALRKLNAGQAGAQLPKVVPNEFGEMALALRQIQQRARQLDHLAYHDVVTGLPNRARLESTLPAMLTDYRSKGGSVALLFLDLDNFKSVNDAFGHGFGDRYLVVAAERLASVLPAGAQLFRYSGDEFTLLIPSLQPDTELLPGLNVATERILAAMSAPCRIDTHSLPMSVSMGVAVFPQDAESATDLLSSADAAMFQAKSAGRNQARHATPDLTASIRQRVFLSGDVRRGLEAGEFEVFFQPVIDVDLRQVVSVEVLMRWNHPVRGLLMPSEFVQAAEESGAIAELGLRGLDRACAQLARFRACAQSLNVAVNISSRQLYNAAFVKRVAEALQRHGVGAEGLELEITEGIMMEQPEESARVLHELHALGVGLCIDDFGTGYSALSYVQRFPIGKIKVDRSFVSRLLQSREAEAIVVATLSMARSLRIEVVAEGVETVAQMKRLQALGCPLQQGFLFTPALPAAEFEYWLDSAPELLKQIVT